MISKLVIDGLVVPILKEIPVSVNFAISDVRDISKRSGAMTKTITLPGSQELDRIFETVFRLNIELSTFNPNYALEGIYYVNEKEQIKGDLQLLNIIHKPGGSVEYQCNIIGREGSFFVTLGDSLLTDLDFSDLDHPFNQTNIVDSWDTSYIKLGVPVAFAYGEGYVYPFINYGYTSSNSTFDVNHFKPAIPVREYFTRIFDAAGYTWTSSFLDGAFFKRLYIPCNKDKIPLSSADISASQYFIGKTAATVTGWQSGTSGGGGAFGHNNIAVFPNYDTETSPYFDSSNQYDSVTNFYSTIANTGVYNVVAFAQLDITVNAPSLVGGTWDNGVDEFACYIEKNTGSGWVLIAAVGNYQTSTNQNLGTAKSYTTNAQSGNVFLAAGTLVRVRTRVEITGTTRNSGGTATSAAYTIDYTLPNGTQKNEHFLLRTDPTLVDGNTLSMNNAIPENIKQKDFVKWVMQMFKLNIEIDKSNETNLIIESEVIGWYSGNVDWTQLVDYSKNWETRPMGELDFRNYILKYKDDKDYYNDQHIKQHIDNYGLKRLTVDNDFIKSDKTIEIGFSPTPLVSNNSNSIVCPHIYQKDGTTLKPMSHNIRILYYGGLKNSGNAWNFTSGAFSVPFTEYPYIGHVDDPLTPTIDLNFWYPKEVYYSYISAYYTTNNLYNAYYSQFLNEITDKDSKIITCYVNLQELDILQLSFRKKVFIQHPVLGGAYYIINKIYDYNPVESKSTKVELLKVKAYSPFVAGAIPIDPGYDPVSTERVLYNPLNNSDNNTEAENTLALGSNNRIYGSGNAAVGSSGCFVDETSTGVTLINCTGVSVIGGENVTIVGASNRTFDSVSNIVVNNSESYNNKIKTQTVTADFSVDEDTVIYYVDCSGGDVTATIDVTAIDIEDKVICFTRTDSSANKFYLDDPSGTVTVLGAATPYDTMMLQYDSIDISLKGTVIYIKG
jgi:hypothetical protein